MASFDIQTLLNLHGEIFPLENGYWTKFEACRVRPDKHTPHGLRYSLSLHDRNNLKIIGFDNAHSVKPKKRKYAGRKVTWDHQHRKEKIIPYEFETAGQLSEDFRAAVERFLGEA